jgi:hypothetical protein
MHVYQNARQNKSNSSNTQVTSKQDMDAPGKTNGDTLAYDLQLN